MAHYKTIKNCSWATSHSYEEVGATANNKKVYFKSEKETL